MASCTFASARAYTSDRISDVGHTYRHEVEPLRAGNSAFKAGRETFEVENGSVQGRKGERGKGEKMGWDKGEG